MKEKTPKKLGCHRHHLNPFIKTLYPERYSKFLETDIIFLTPTQHMNVHKVLNKENMELTKRVINMYRRTWSDSRSNVGAI